MILQQTGVTVYTVPSCKVFSHKCPNPGDIQSKNAVTKDDLKQILTKLQCHYKQNQVKKYSFPDNHLKPVKQNFTKTEENHDYRQ